MNTEVMVKQKPVTTNEDTQQLLFQTENTELVVQETLPPLQNDNKELEIQELLKQSNTNITSPILPTIVENTVTQNINANNILPLQEQLSYNTIVQPPVIKNVFNEKTNTTTSLEEEQIVSKLFVHYQNKALNVPSTNATSTLNDMTTYSNKIVASLATTAHVLVETGNTLGTTFTVSETLNEELKTNISKYDDYIKSLSNAAYVKWAGAIVGIGMVTYFTYKMGLLRQIPTMFSHILDIIPSAIPSANAASNPVKDAVNNTLNASHDATGSTIMDFLKSPVMPLTTITIATITLVSYVVVMRTAARTIRFLRKLK